MRISLKFLDSGEIKYSSDKVAHWTIQKQFILSIFWITKALIINKKWEIIFKCFQEVSYYIVVVVFNGGWAVLETHDWLIHSFIKKILVNYHVLLECASCNFSQNQFFCFMFFFGSWFFEPSLNHVLLFH